MAKSDTDKILHPGSAKGGSRGKQVPPAKSGIIEGPSAVVKSTPYAKGEHK